METQDRVCPACLTALPNSHHLRRWCSARCRRWVHRVGGPERAAGLKESWAKVWDHSRPELATKLQREAEALRAVALERNER